MTLQTPIEAAAVFPLETRGHFARNYPEVPHQLRHSLRNHPLLTVGALAELGELLPERSVEYNRGDLPIGVDGKPEGTGLAIGETIRAIESSNS